MFTISNPIETSASPASGGELKFGYPDAFSPRDRSLLIHERDIRRADESLHIRGVHRIKIIIPCVASRGCHRRRFCGSLGVDRFVDYVIPRAGKGKANRFVLRGLLSSVGVRRRDLAAGSAGRRCLRNVGTCIRASESARGKAHARKQNRNKFNPVQALSPP